MRLVRTSSSSEPRYLIGMTESADVQHVDASRVQREELTVANVGPSMHTPTVCRSIPSSPRRSPASLRSYQVVQQRHETVNVLLLRVSAVDYGRIFVHHCLHPRVQHGCIRRFSDHATWMHPALTGVEPALPPNCSLFGSCRGRFPASSALKPPRCATCYQLLFPVQPLDITAASAA